MRCAPGKRTAKTPSTDPGSDVSQPIECRRHTGQKEQGQGKSLGARELAGQGEAQYEGYPAHGEDGERGRVLERPAGAPDAGDALGVRRRSGGEGGQAGGRNGRREHHRDQPDLLHRLAGQLPRGGVPRRQRHGGERRARSGIGVMDRERHRVCCRDRDQPGQYRVETAPGPCQRQSSEAEHTEHRLRPRVEPSPSERETQPGTEHGHHERFPDAGRHAARAYRAKRGRARRPKGRRARRCASASTTRHGVIAAFQVSQFGMLIVVLTRFHSLVIQTLPAVPDGEAAGSGVAPA